LRTLARWTAQQFQGGLPEGWLWHGRRVFSADGSHISMPDTEANQAAYPRPAVQQPGPGFPLARVAVLLSLATGACHDLASAPYTGKGTGETTLLRQMYGVLQPGDVVIADALFDNYFLACELRRRGLELVARVQAERVGSQTIESRPDGDLIVWQRPNKPRGMTGEQYRRYPKTLLMRQVAVGARGRDNRAEQFHVVAALLDASISGGEFGGLYERRWDGEVDLRSIQVTLQMDILRCKTPEMVRKEIWAHLLAYNLLRTVMAVAANKSHVEPRAISFKGAKQVVRAFAPKREAAQPERRAGLMGALLKAVAYHRVGDRQGCWEPRARKRRPKPGKRRTQPRRSAKLAHNRAKWYERNAPWAGEGGLALGRPSCRARRVAAWAAPRLVATSRGVGGPPGRAAQPEPRQGGKDRPLSIAGCWHLDTPGGSEPSLPCPPSTTSRDIA
jgi:hypothetical protein